MPAKRAKSASSFDPAPGRCFIDTNVLVYAEAADAPDKQARALALLRALHAEGRGILSIQVLQEYCQVALRKMSLSPSHVRAQLHLLEQFEVFEPTPALVVQALDLHETRRLSFYDALIVAAALNSACTTLYSEDLNAGETIRGLRIVNPFA